MGNRSLSQEVRAEIASAFASLVDQHSPQLREHSRRVARWARALGLALGPDYALDEEDVTDLEIAGFLHDIGLVTIPCAVLCRGGSEAETADGARQHVVSGYAALSNIQSFERIAVGILHHHEQFDGQGFPQHLWRRAIPLFARILAVIDAYDHALHPGFAMAAQDGQRAIRLLAERSGRGLDPGIVRVFLDVVRASEGNRRDEGREIELPTHSLRPGMVLTRELRSVGNVMLLKSGTQLTEALIERILHHDVAENVVTSAFVDRFSVDELPTPPPVTSDEALSVAPRSAADAVAAARRRVLVLGERMTAVHALRAELEPLGMEVSGPLDPGRAGEPRDAPAADAVIVDLAVGGPRAREAVERLARDAAAPHCVAVAFSRTDAGGDVRSLSNVAATLSAPWSRGALADAVRKAIDLNHHHRSQSRHEP